MLADIVTPSASWLNDRSLLTYTVPPELEAELRVGQLVAVPYRERLVEGIVWQIHADDAEADSEETLDLRPLHAIVDIVTVLLPHQMALAEWMSRYYVTPLAQVLSMMLPRTLVQRSQVVLRLAQDAQEEDMDIASEPSLRLRALAGLLLVDGTLDVEQL